MKNRIQILSLGSANEIEREFSRIGVDAGGIEKMLPKSKFLLIKIKDLDPVICNILKQEILSKNGEAAVHRNVINLKVEKSDVLLMSTERVMKEFLRGLKGHYFGIPQLMEDINSTLEKYSSHPKPWKIRNSEFAWGEKTFIMGILNVTPDSFSDGGKFLNLEDAVNQAFKMIEEGADIIDIGGESSRPGSDPVSEDEEINRVIPIIKKIREKSDIPISIDTYKPKTAEAAINAGADIINDITGGINPELLNTANKFNLPIILMHMKGTPKNMQREPYYENLMDELIEFFYKQIKNVKAAGIEKVIIDPGIGFGKRLEDNLEIIRRLKEFKIFGTPILIGPSRKSFIGTVLGGETDERMEGTLAAVAISTLNGGDIIRVHDVKEMKKVILMTNAIKGINLK
ncbi:dihydropteroate synthase [Candidatus Dependentiae bacterium]|nr:dihydropteroate synthase [Candidatus Dependentiae bacterium]